MLKITKSFLVIIGINSCMTLSAVFYRVKNTGDISKPQNAFNFSAVESAPTPELKPIYVKRLQNHKELKDIELQGRIPFRNAGNPAITPSSGSTSNK